MSVVLETTLGDITIDLYYEERPICCKNFLFLCEIKYYNFCLFHSIQTNFIAQTGDPTGTGYGGQSIWNKPFRDECHPKLQHTGRGMLSMANSGPNTNKSQL